MLRGDSQRYDDGYGAWANDFLRGERTKAGVLVGAGCAVSGGVWVYFDEGKCGECDG